jgi:hypothetical protein
MLKLDSPAAFTGHVVGLTGSDVIDFAGFNAATTSASYATSTGELTVADANHSVSMALTGNYANSVFTVASDGHGGVNVVDPPAATLAQSAIAPPALAISGSDASVTSSGSVIGVDGTIVFTAAHPSDPLAASSHALVSGTGSGGSLVLDPIAETHGIGTLGWHFDFDAKTLADLAPGEVMSASYDVTISQAQSSVAATQRLTLSVGGSGNDAFVFHPGEGAAVITNFTSQSSTPDHIELNDIGIATFSELQQSIHATHDGRDTLINLGHGDSIVVVGVQPNQLHASDFVFHPAGHT